MRERRIERKQFEELSELTRYDFDQHVAGVSCILLLGIVAIVTVMFVGIAWMGLNGTWEVSLLIAFAGTQALRVFIYFSHTKIALAEDEGLAFYLVWEEGKARISVEDYGKYYGGKQVAEGIEAKELLKII